MRVLLVSEDIPYPNMGGLAKHVLNLAHALVRAGHQVDLLGGDQHPLEVAGKEGKFNGRFFGELNGHLTGWKEIQLGMYLPPKRTWLARRFARIIMRHAAGYDVIHYHGHVPNVALFIPEEINFVQTRHDQGSECLAQTRYYRNETCTSTDPADCGRCRISRPNRLQRAISEMAVIRFREEVAEGFRRHKTVFVSNFLERNFTRAVGPGPWGVTVHHFVDTELLAQVRREAERSLPSHREIFTAAKLYPAKGVEALLRELVPRLTPDMRVSIAGDGPDETRLRTEFESAQVRFLGWCAPERTLEIAAQSSAVVMPSLLEEAFGSVTLEGLLLGKPVFALARGASSELMKYAATKEQLRLHGDMAALVKDLLSFRPIAPFSAPPASLGGEQRAVQKLLRIYRAPPGRFFS